MNRNDQSIAILQFFKSQPENFFTEKQVTGAMEMIYGDANAWYVSDILQEYVKTGVLEQKRDQSFRYLSFEDRQVG